MARVYQARPAEAGSDRPASYAVKVLREHWQDDPLALAQWKREVFVGQAVHHRNVVSVLDWRGEGPPYYIVFPYLEGGTLEQQLHAHGPPSLPLALWITRQIAEALAALYGAGWMHADVKPANIFVAGDGHATLLDLGYARRLGQPGHIGDRAVVGTLDYMAPEMLTSTLAPDVRSDIYSLGVTLYRLLTGRLPFPGCNPAEVARLHREGNPDHLRRLNPLLPAGAVQLVRRMLAKDPLRRPQTPSEVVDRLVALEVETFSQRVPA